MPQYDRAAPVASWLDVQSWVAIDWWDLAFFPSAVQNNLSQNNSKEKI